MLLPYAAESYPLTVHAAQLLSLLAFVPGLASASLLVLVPVGAVAQQQEEAGAETRGRDLRELEAATR
jgi:hypothetical protein